jgi:DNA-binding response OmpR family regulator
VAQTIKILLADDDPDVRETLEAILAEPGYTVLTASDGYEAVRLLAEHWINLLITDVRMPGINGFELARQAKLMRPQIQVIYFSGFSSNEERHPGPLYGPVLEKPLRMADVLAQVNRQLRE